MTWLGISVIVLWGWYWLASADNRHAHSLTDLAIEQFETIDETKWAVKDSNSYSEARRCFTTEQNADVALDPGAYPDGPGEDQIPGRHFAALNQFADNLEQQGWNIDRFKDYRSSVNTTEGELARLGVFAFKDSDQITATATDSSEIRLKSLLGANCTNPILSTTFPEEFLLVDRLEPDSN